MTFDLDQLKTFPQDPGVYLMRDAKGGVLYVGKAKNLRQRVKQYFAKHGDGRPMVPYLIKKVDHIDTIVVTSEKEALLLENTLIKEYQPPYNALLKDDKSFISLRINTQHKWPMIQIVRYRGRPKGKGLFFGPYTSAGAARQTFDLLNRIFPLRQCCDQELARRDRPCILHQMKRCAAPCVAKCTKEEYDGHVAQTIQFLRGQDREVLQGLKERMERYSEAMEYERAGEVLQTIRYIEKTVERQKVDRVNGADADIIGVYRQGDEVVVVILIYRHGKLMGTQDYLFSGSVQDDEELIESFLLQQYLDSDQVPSELLLPIRVEGVDGLEEVLSIQRKVHVNTPQRGSKKQLVELANANAKATFVRKKDATAIAEKTLLAMQARFHLDRPPRRIECLDTSHLSGEDPVAALVCFVDGVKEASGYRKYKIKTAKGGDDYGAMEEVLKRRFKKAKEENGFPDLLVVDGGKGHLNMAKRVLSELDIISVNVIGVAKEAHRHDKGITAEQVFLPNVKDAVLLKKTSPILFLLQKIRDEAHRSAITFQRKRRSKQRFTSELSKIPGIGPVKERRLLKHFGSVKELKKKDVDAIASVEGVSKENAKIIWKTLNH